MKPISRTRTQDLAAAELREGILAGQWSGRLPGARVLAKRLGVSPPTVAAALEGLAAEGLLLKPGERQAYQVADTRRPAPAAGGAKRLLILTPEEPSALIETSRRILEVLRIRMLGKGWLVDSQVVDFLHVKRPQRAWDRIIQADHDSRVIALYGRQALAEWALRRKVRMFFLGGTPGGLPIPMVAVKSTRLLEIALLRLTALGHWKVVIPLCDRAGTFKEAMREVTRRVIEASGHHYVASYHNPESDYLTPDVTGRIIESAFAVDPPTALVFLDWKELVTAHCVLSKLRLSVPADVSLVLLNDQMEAEWFQPALCRFRFPERRLVNTMVAWLEGRLAQGGSGRITLPAEFIEGGTMAAPG
jgi:hypothetical protein